MSRLVIGAALVTTLVGVAGCSGETMPTPTPTPTETFTPTGDGELKIGTLFPTTGGTAFIGAAQVAGVNAALREINAAGGVNGTPVVVLNRDSGDASTQKVEESFADLVAQGADVIIGPSSSVLSQRLLEAAAEEGIPLISSAATYPQLTVLDEEGYFFRTIASYPHQALVLADIFSEGDISEVAVVYRDDDLGRTLTTTLTRALEPLQIEVVAVSVAADANADAIAAAVADVKEAAPDVVVLATPDNGDQTKALITQLSAAGLGGAKLWLTSQNLADYSQALPGGMLNGVNGIIEGAHPDEAFQAKIKQEDPGVPDFRYSMEAYDATILVALAAELAGDDGGESIARELRAASIGGIKCTSYGECLSVLRTEPDFDYDGVSGSVNLDRYGDVQRGSYTIVVYNGENKYNRQSNRIG